MNCEEFQSQIGTARDGELDGGSRHQLEVHLAECSECREVAEGLDCLDSLLRRTLRPMRRRADELATRVTLKLAEPLSRPVTRRVAMWPRLAAAVAAGFLVACLVFQPWRGRMRPEVDVPIQAGTVEDPLEEASPGEMEMPALDVAVAQVMASTGPIDVRFPDQVEWVTFDEVAPFQCPSDTFVKTPSGSLCELETSTGCVVRMRDETEVKVHNADELELNGGHVWCQVPESGRLLVTATVADAVSAENAAIQADAVGPAVMMQCVNPDPPTVTSCSGRIDVGNGTETIRLAAGGSVQHVDGAFVSSVPGAAPLLAEAWMHPLLMRNGHHNPELGERVDALLAQVGDMKLSLLYEQQIRGLGEYSALPLLRFIQTPTPDVDEERRVRAARILADIAPVWMVPDLIGLLSDDNPRIRSAGDQALIRLTGHESGMTAEMWAGDHMEWAAAAAEWSEWWAQFEPQYMPVPEMRGGWSMDDLQYQKARNLPSQ